MILNAKNNEFVFKFPKGFIYPEIETKYNFYLKRLPTPFETITDYVNHTIQSVTFPSVASDEIEQWVGRRTEVDTTSGSRVVTKNPHYWRQNLDLDRVIPKEFTVNMKVADGYLNYWVMYETYKYFLTTNTTSDYFPDLNIEYLDRDGYQLLTLSYRQPIMKGISEVEMSYASTAMEFRTFAVNFKYNDFDINVKLD